MTKTPERRVKEAIWEYLDGLGADIFYYNVIGSPLQRTGIPDIICCYKGKFFAFEAKRADGKGRVDPLQRVTIADIQRAGGIALVVESVEEVKKVLDMA